jgi:hypothetical protein
MYKFKGILPDQYDRNKEPGSVKKAIQACFGLFGQDYTRNNCLTLNARIIGSGTDCVQNRSS